MTQITRTQTFINDNGETYYQGECPKTGKTIYSFSDDFEDYWTEEEQEERSIALHVSSFNATLAEHAHEAYLDYANNYLTSEVFAEHRGISVTFAKALIQEGRNINDDNF